MKYIFYQGVIVTPLALCKHLIRVLLHHKNGDDARIICHFRWHSSPLTREAHNREGRGERVREREIAQGRDIKGKVTTIFSYLFIFFMIIFLLIFLWMHARVAIIYSINAKANADRALTWALTDTRTPRYWHSQILALTDTDTGWRRHLARGEPKLSNDAIIWGGHTADSVYDGQGFRLRDWANKNLRIVAWAMRQEVRRGRKRGQHTGSNTWCAVMKYTTKKREKSNRYNIRMCERARQSAATMGISMATWVVQVARRHRHRYRYIVEYFGPPRECLKISLVFPHKEN